MILLALLLLQSPTLPTTRVEKLTPAEQRQLAEAHTDQQKRAAENIIAHNHRADEDCGCYVGKAPVTWVIKNGTITITKR